MQPLLLHDESMLAFGVIYHACSAAFDSYSHFDFPQSDYTCDLFRETHPTGLQRWGTFTADVKARLKQSDVEVCFWGSSSASQQLSATHPSWPAKMHGYGLMRASAACCINTHSCICHVPSQPFLEISLFNWSDPWLCAGHARQGLHALPRREAQVHPGNRGRSCDSLFRSCLREDRSHLWQ